MRATALGRVPTLKAAIYGLDPAREERGKRRADSSSCSPLVLGRGAVAHIRAHALQSSSCCFPSPQASATPPVRVPHYLPGSSLLIHLLLGVCQCPVPMCLPVHAALSSCLALSIGSGCLGLLAHPQPFVFFCSVTFVCLSLRLPSSACLCLCLHLPPLALFILVNRTGTCMCIQVLCTQVGWNCTG